MCNLFSQSALGLIKPPVQCMRISQNENLFTFTVENCSGWEAPAWGATMAMRKRGRWGQSTWSWPSCLEYSWSPLLSQLLLLLFHSPTHEVFSLGGTNICMSLRPRIAFLWTGDSPTLQWCCGLSHTGTDNLLPAFPQFFLYPEGQASSLGKWYGAKTLFMAVERRADQSKCLLSNTALLERVQWVRCGNDLIDTGLTQELRTGWPFDPAVKIPTDTGTICLKTLPLCAEGPAVGTFGSCTFWAGPTWSWCLAEVPGWEVSSSPLLVSFWGQSLMCRQLQVVTQVPGVLNGLLVMLSSPRWHRDTADEQVS